MTLETIRKEALRLPKESKEELVSILLESISSLDEYTLTKGQEAELDRRMARIESGEATFVTKEELEQNLIKKHGYTR